MPGAAVHIQLARAVADAWPEEEAPLRFEDPAVLNAFYHGALGPDMGYFPGADPLLADLAHYVSSGGLARNLLSRASSEFERAYAWGWVTHLLADSEMHPLVNRAAGAVLYGSTDRPATYADSAATHARVEFGVDAVRLVRDGGLEGLRLQPVFDEESIGFLRDALVDTYAVDFGTANLLKAHRAVNRFQGPIFGLGSLVGRRHLARSLHAGDLPFHALYLPVRWVSGLVAKDSTIYGFTHTLRPASWLDQAVDQWAQAFPEHFAELVAGGIDELPDWNLDIGVVEDPSDPYPLTVRTERDLEARRRA